MSKKIDTEALLASTNIVSVIEKHVALKKSGHEWSGLCPFHNDEKKSLQVNESKQIFKCFACGEGGDSIAFLMKLGYSFKEAVTEINGGSVDVEIAPVHNHSQMVKRPSWKQIVPEGKPTSFSHYRHGKPSRTWEYRNKEGDTFGYICRFDTTEGKEVIPYIYATDGSRSEWRWQGFDKPRPLYNLVAILEQPEATVMVVEGEKTADAAQALFPHAVVTCWQGGARAIKHTDWTPLFGRKVVLWPDNDQPGVEAMQDIAEIIVPDCAVVKFVTNPPDAPKHWDLADAEWTPEQAQAYAKANMGKVPAREVVAEPEPVQQAPMEFDQVPPFDDSQFDNFEHLPEEHIEPVFFRFLGFTNHGGSLSHNFYSHGSRTVISLSPSGLSKNNLLELAPINWWEQQFPGARKGFDTEAAANWLIQTSLATGTFSDRYIRGRGAWIDKNNVVIHTGDRLVVDGEPRDMREFKSRFIYEFSEPLGFNTTDALPTSDANKLIEIVEQLNWDREISAYLLIGWCIVAPVCGALSWRPHIWLTGAAGTGKSWVFKNIVRRLMGDTAMAVQGETSEAGLRQMLGHDALPVVFDEAEGEDRRSQDRMQSVMALMRAASADDGGIMAKGSSSGTAKTYRIRSCFAFASIAVQVAQQSDRTRVTVLGLRKATDAGKDEQWKRLNALYQELVTNEFVRRLQARTVKLVPVIIENARTFSNAAAAELGEQRIGDQLGAMLAGAYSLFSNKLISYDDAVAWVRSKDWTEEKGLDRTRDEMALLMHLLDQMLRVETLTSGHERNIGELVSIAAGRTIDELITLDIASQKLRRIGMKIDGDFLVISNTADWVKSKLRDTPWAKNHNKILMRIDQARSFDSTRFASGVQTRAVGVPLWAIFGDPSENA